MHFSTPKPSRAFLVLCLGYVLLLLPLQGCATTARPPLDYETLAARAASGEMVPVADLKEALLGTADFSTRLRTIAPLEQQALQLMEDEPLRLGAIGAAILDNYYASLIGHMASQKYYDHLEADDATELHRRWIEHIQTSIERNRDGSKEHPYVVLSASEANGFLRSKNLTPVGSMYQTNSSVPLVMLEIARPVNGPLKSLYFDLSDAYGAVEDTLKAENPDQSMNPTLLINYLAQKNDSAAQALIGAYLISDNRLEDAAEWLTAATRNGNLLADLMLAQVYQRKARALTGQEQKEYMEFALENYLHAIAAGSDEAMFALGGLYLNGSFGEDNIPSGITLLRQAADLENTSAMLWLAQLYASGTEVDQDRSEAAEYYRKAAALEDDRARIQYVRFLLTPGQEQPVDRQAIEWLQQAADNERPEAMILMGNLYARGDGKKRSFRKALKWYKAAVATAPEDANIVNEVAWTLAVSHLEGLRNPKYALTLMNHTMAADDEARANPAFLDTWAAAYAATGDFENATAVQKKAVDAAAAQEQSDDLEVLTQHLEAFKRGETVVDPVP